MNTRKNVCLVLALALLVALAACSAPAPTPTPAPPTPTPAPTPVLATSAEQIAGTWWGMAADGMYQRINKDGTWLTGTSLQSLANGGDAELTFRFEGTQLILTEVKATGLPPCAAKTGTYQVQLLPNGNIKFLKVQDSCGPRARTMAQEHKPVR